MTEQVKQGFEKQFGRKADYIFSAPGRTELSGNHTDHQHGCVMAAAVNRVAENKGGIVVMDGGKIIAELPLPVAGLITDRPLEEVNAALEACKNAAIQRGTAEGIDPFMTMSFASLPVIPTLRLTTRGVIDVNTQTFID